MKLLKLLVILGGLACYQSLTLANGANVACNSSWDCSTLCCVNGTCQNPLTNGACWTN